MYVWTYIYMYKYRYMYKYKYKYKYKYYVLYKIQDSLQDTRYKIQEGKIRENKETYKGGDLA